MSPSILQFIADFNSQLRYNSNSHVRKYTNISLNFSEIRLPYDLLLPERFLDALEIKQGKRRETTGEHKQFFLLV